MLDIVDSMSVDGKKTFHRADYYLVKDYTDSKSTVNFIDSVINTNKAGNLGEYSDYAMIFFKESSQTNEQNIIESRQKVIDRYSIDHDEIYEYRWSNGKFLAKYEVGNGVILNPRNSIKIFDVPKR
jgi:hypothetical protein